MTPRSRALLHLWVALSGFAGLVWQLVWVRQLGLAFGSTVEAVTLVTAVFLAGLGVGARVAGQRADGVASPGRAYAVCEIGVAAWGLLLVPVLAWLGDHGVGGAAPDARGWLVPTAWTRLGELGVTALLLGPPTALMGASLPLLARPAVAGRLEHAGLRLGLLAAANTGGAALGALLTDLVLVPALGMRGACVLAAALGGIAALGALRGDRRPTALGGVAAPTAPTPETPATATPTATLATATPNSTAPTPTTPATPTPETPAAPLPPVAIALALAGFAAMGFEVVWFRFLGSALGPYRAVFSQLLGVLLVGWLLGAVLAGALGHPRIRRHVGPAALFALAQAAVGTLALAGLALHDPRALLVRQLALADTGASTAARLAVNLGVVAAVVLPAAFAMGAAFPLANTLAQRAEATVGRTASRLWLATTLGNAGGACVTGLWLLPALGMQGTALLLAALAALAPVALLAPAADASPWLATRLPGREVEPRLPPALLSAAGLLSVVTFTAFLDADHVVWASFPHGRAQEEGVLAVDEGRDATVVVTGRPEGPARLWTNGHPMSSTLPSAQRYMRLLAHLPLLAQKAPEDVLIVCFGVGNTLHAASLHPSVTRLHLADLSAAVLAQAPLFAHANRGVLDDPRVTVHLDDGRHVIRGFQPGTFDLIALEPPPLAHAGVASLYTREFYALAADRLAPGGWLTQWLPAYQVPEETVLALVRAFVEVFPDAVLLVGDGRELLLAGVRGGVPTLDAPAVSVRMTTPGIAEDLAAIGISDVSALAATFAADGAHLRQITAGTPPMTDDRPVAEWSQVSHVAATRLPAGLFRPQRWPGFAPALAGDAKLTAIMDENARRWESEAYRTYTNLPAPAAR